MARDAQRRKPEEVRVPPPGNYRTRVAKRRSPGRTRRGVASGAALRSSDLARLCGTRQLRFGMSASGCARWCTGRDEGHVSGRRAWALACLLPLRSGISVARAFARRRAPPGALPRGEPGLTHVLAVVNQKGGVGKTTTSVNLAAALAQAARRVLLVDLDPQGNATMGSGIDKRTAARTVYHVLLGLGEISAIRMRAERGGYDLVPANRELAGAEVELVA